MTPFSRRQFVKNSLLFGSALAFPFPSRALARNSKPDGTAPIGDLTGMPLRPLPLGAVQAGRWLEHQMRLQTHGITGRMENYPDYTGASAWRGGTGEDWERGPYYVRGLVALAYTLDDPELKTKARRWIDWSLDNQRADGYFGPKRQGDWWSRMPMLLAIRDYYEATGKKDARVLPFLEKYFRYQLAALPKRPLSNWADARGADNIDSVLWYYQELIANGTSRAGAAWLLDLARLLHKQTQPWSRDFNHGTVRFHVVNTTQALKYPPVVYRLTRDESDRAAFANGIFNWGLDHGRVDGLPNSDEAARDNQSTRGTETCAVVEALLSTGIALRDFGDPALGDYLEHIAYNALPLTTTPDFSGHTYYAVQNQVMATLGYHGFDCDHGDSCAFGAPLGFDCCFSNMHMGWAKFVQHMWMKNDAGGLALVAYGPNRVAAPVADGKTAVFQQETDYPFRDTVRLTYQGDTAEFPLDLRIPDWAAGAVVKINGETAAGVVAGEFFRVHRAFKNGDVLELTFPSKIETSRWYNDSVAVQKGALIYALNIEEDWRVYTSNDARELKVPSLPEQPLREVYPASRWNYALCVEETTLGKDVKISEQPVPLQPWSSKTAPVSLKVLAQVLPDWTLEGNKAGPQPLGPVRFDRDKTEPVELIPYGCGRLKIAHFPRVHFPENFMKRDIASAKKRSRDGGLVVEFDNVIVGPASDYELRVHASGAGVVGFQLNGRKFGEIGLQDGAATRAGLRGLIAAESFKFKEQQYNNLRFTGAGAEKITAIEIVPAEKIAPPQILEISGGDTFAQIRTNLPRSVATYRIHYGARRGRPDRSASGFAGDTAVLTGLKTGTSLFFSVEARVNGSVQRSAEVAFTPGSGATVENDTPVAFSDNFSSFSTLDAHWEKFGAADQINIENNRLVLARHPNVKILAGESAWRNYACEAVVRLNDAGSGDAGLLARVSAAADGPDAFRGVYFGISAQGFLTIGESENQWRELKRSGTALAANRDYRLKIAARGNRMAFYLDDRLVHVLSDTRHLNGRVGLRGYQQGFSCGGVVVRPLNPDEVKTLGTDTEQETAAVSDTATKPEISAVSAFECVQLKYSCQEGVTAYKIEYGTRPGEHTHAVYSVRPNPYKGGRIFSADKFAVGGLENGRTYYFRLVPLRGNRELTPSDEIVVTPNFREKVDKEELRRAIRAAENGPAGASLRDALAHARQVVNATAANQMDVEVALRNLRVVGGGGSH